MPETTSSYAEEGTQAHELGEKLIRQQLWYDAAGEVDIADTGIELPGKKEDYPAGMYDYMVGYKDFVTEQFAEAKARNHDAIIEVEFMTDTSAWIPEGFGHCDVAIISDQVLTVIDYKHGMGVPVTAEGNPQLKIYGLGALAKLGVLFDVKEVHVIVYQPRIDNIVEANYTVEELYEWADNELAVKAQIAWKGEGEFVPGKHCQFCRVKGTCRALADYNMNLMFHDLKGPALLDESEIPEILRASELLVMWANAVKEYALAQAEQGKEWPGYKLVEGRSNRKITNEEEFAARLIEKKFDPTEIYNSKLKGITELEKLVGKKPFAEEFSDLIIKPKGAPTLVPETDKRASLTDQMFD